MGKKVIILGGGVGGMSAAHELVERGFEVEVYERHLIPGGKARSIPVFESQNDHGSRGIHGPALRARLHRGGFSLEPHRRRRWLPGEHGFRFFPSFYKHVIDTMGRIPYGSGHVSDNLVDTSEVLFARDDRGSLLAPAQFPRTLSGVKLALDDLLAVFSGKLGVPPDEIEHYGWCLWKIMTSCGERRLGEYEKIGWWEFIGAASRSENYRKMFASGITRSLVASRAEVASARTVGDINLQLVLGITDPGTPTSDRLLNGPTNEVWILPWLQYLQSRGVKYQTDTWVRSINFSGGRITGATIEKDGSKSEVRGDLYIAAMPVERIVPLITGNMVMADPALGRLSELAKSVEWMNGIQYYLTRDVPITHGHTIYIDAPWALTSVSQAQFWRDFDLSEFGDGKVRGIISVDISNWDAKGHNGKAGCHCSRDEIAAEVWEQLKRGLNHNGQKVLRDEDLHYWFLDPDIRRASTGRLDESNTEPLLVNLVNTWSLRPEAATAIPNLFLASDYVRTYTDLATMEGANEAARRAVNGILERTGSSASPCQIWKLHEPEVFRPLRDHDRTRWEAGLPWDDRLMGAAFSALDAVQKAAGPAFKSAEPLFAAVESANQAGTAGPAGGRAGSSEAEALLNVSNQILSIADRRGTADFPGPASALPAASRPRLPFPLADDTGSPPPRRPRIRITQKR